MKVQELETYCIKKWNFMTRKFQIDFMARLTENY